MYPMFHIYHFTYARRTFEWNHILEKFRAVKYGAILRKQLVIIQVSRKFLKKKHISYPLIHTPTCVCVCVCVCVSGGEKYWFFVIFCARTK